MQEVARGIGLDKRIGPKFLNAGPGYGGSCFPKDTVALIKTAQDFGSPMRLIETTEAINTARKRSIARKIIAACGGDVSERRIAVLGLTFKPNTDDMREAPSLAIIQALQDAGATIAAYDPEGMENARTMLQGVEFGIDAYDVARDADALVIVTEWNAFRAMDFRRLKQVMRTPLLVDLRNIYRKEEVRGEGFAYVGVGRPAEDYLSPLHIGLKTAGA